MYVQPMWIKICGLNDPSLAREIAALGPDAIGLNFYERSVRFVTPTFARQIAEDLPPAIAAIVGTRRHAPEGGAPGAAPRDPPHVRAG